MVLLQAKIIESSTTVILNYGAIGAILILCVVALFWMARYFVKQSEKKDALYASQFATMRQELNKYIEDDRKEMIRVVVDNTRVIRDFINSVEELRKEIHEFKNK